MRVEGLSMWPTLSAGDRVLVKAIPEHASLPDPGTIVVSQHPSRPNHRLIKRLAEVDSTGAMILLGDHPAQSTDSRQLGPIPRSCLIGSVQTVVRQTSKH